LPFGFDQADARLVQQVAQFDQGAAQGEAQIFHVGAPAGHQIDGTFLGNQPVEGRIEPVMEIGIRHRAAAGDRVEAFHQAMGQQTFEPEVVGNRE